MQARQPLVSTPPRVTLGPLRPVAADSRPLAHNRQRSKWTKTSVAEVTAAMTFEPRIDGSAASVLTACMGLGGYWWFVLVPSERAALAKEKRKGALGEYLKVRCNVSMCSHWPIITYFYQEVNNDPQRSLERWFYTDWLQSKWFKAKTAAGLKRTEGIPSSEGADGLLEGPPSDNLLKPTYETPTPSFWSLDNPIVAAAALIATLGLASSVIH